LLNTGLCSETFGQLCTIKFYAYIVYKCYLTILLQSLSALSNCNKWGSLNYEAVMFTFRVKVTAEFIPTEIMDRHKLAWQESYCFHLWRMR